MTVSDPIPSSETQILDTITVIVLILVTVYLVWLMQLDDVMESHGV